MTIHVQEIMILAVALHQCDTGRSSTTKLKS